MSQTQDEGWQDHLEQEHAQAEIKKRISGNKLEKKGIERRVITGLFRAEARQYIGKSREKIF